MKVFWSNARAKLEFACPQRLAKEEVGMSREDVTKIERDSSVVSTFKDFK